MEVAKYIEQQLKAQFDVQREIFEQRIEEDNQVILAYDKDLRKANTKLDRIKEAINCDDYHKEHCIYCSEAHHCYTKQVLEIIGE